MNKILTLLSVIFLMTGCPTEQKIKYPIGIFPTQVTNFQEINSQYDDYNSDLHWIFDRLFFQFSSNRNSYGGNYDIVGRSVNIIWDQENGNFSLDVDYPVAYHPYFKPMQDSLNTSSDEFGPLTLSYFNESDDYTGEITDLMLYANNCNDDFDIRLIYAESNIYNVDSTFVIHPVQNLNIVNTEADELYPTFFGGDIYNSTNSYLDVKEFQKIIFCSNRTGNFDFYQANLVQDSGFVKALTSSDSLEVSRLEISSSADDKCCWVLGHLMVFASNRPGGYGGFDLYYSHFKNGAWEIPVNFGEGVNTEHDEYRPIIHATEGFENQLMIFSSNRPGGKGGFDLYYVGTNVMN